MSYPDPAVGLLRSEAVPRSYGVVKRGCALAETASARGAHLRILQVEKSEHWHIHYTRIPVPEVCNSSALRLDTCASLPSSYPPPPPRSSILPGQYCSQPPIDVVQLLASSSGVRALISSA
jgi:hypothetical protein